jgi:hypothetical protein
VIVIRTCVVPGAVVAACELALAGVPHAAARAVKQSKSKRKKKLGSGVLSALWLLAKTTFRVSECPKPTFVWVAGRRGLSKANATAGLPPERMCRISSPERNIELAEVNEKLTNGATSARRSPGIQPLIPIQFFPENSRRVDVRRWGLSTRHRSTADDNLGRNIE